MFNKPVAQDQNLSAEGLYSVFVKGLEGRVTMGMLSNHRTKSHWTESEV